MLGWNGIGCSMVVLAECMWVVVVLEYPETFPPHPKAMVLSASLGQSELSWMFVIEIFVQPLAAGRWEGMRRQPCFPTEC